MAENDLCGCGKEVVSIITTDEGEYCEACFNKKYGAKYRNAKKENAL